MLDPKRGEFGSQVVDADKQHIRTLRLAIQCDRSQQDEGGQQGVHGSVLPRQIDMDLERDSFGWPTRIDRTICYHERMLVSIFGSLESLPRSVYCGILFALIGRWFTV